MVDWVQTLLSWLDVTIVLRRELKVLWEETKFLSKMKSAQLFGEIAIEFSQRGKHVGVLITKSVHVN